MAATIHPSESRPLHLDNPMPIARTGRPPSIAQQAQMHRHPTWGLPIISNSIQEPQTASNSTQGRPTAISSTHERLTANSTTHAPANMTPDRRQHMINAGLASVHTNAQGGKARPMTTNRGDTLTNIRRAMSRLPPTLLDLRGTRMRMTAPCPRTLHVRRLSQHPGGLYTDASFFPSHTPSVHLKLSGLCVYTDSYRAPASTSATADGDICNCSCACSAQPDNVDQATRLGELRFQPPAQAQVRGQQCRYACQREGRKTRAREGAEAAGRGRRPPTCPSRATRSASNRTGPAERCTGPAN